MTQSTLDLKAARAAWDAAWDNYLSAWHADDDGDDAHAAHLAAAEAYRVAADAYYVAAFKKDKQQ